MTNNIHEILARNVKILMNHYDMTQDDIEKKTGVSQRTISNVINPGSVGSITTKTIEKIADYFGLEYWHLLIPNISIDELVSKRIEKVVVCYTQSEPAGRENIARISENEVRYSQIEKPPQKQISNGKN